MTDACKTCTHHKCYTVKCLWWLRHLCAVVIVLAGCGANPKPFKGPNGHQAYTMSCAPAWVADCYRKAGELCQDGYTLVDVSSSTSGVPMQGGTLIASRRNLAIECK